MNIQYKTMNYKQLSIEASKLLAQGWFKNIDKIKEIHNEMLIKRNLEDGQK